MVLLILRPRLVIYNISVDQLRPILAEVVERMDPEARWAGDCLFLPGLGVQLHLESFGWMRNVSLVSSGPKQDYQGWSRLEVGVGRGPAERRSALEPQRPDVAQHRQRPGPLAGLGHHSRSARDRADGVRVAGYEVSVSGGRSCMTNLVQPIEDSRRRAISGRCLACLTIAAAGIVYV